MRLIFPLCSLIYLFFFVFFCFFVFPPNDKCNTRLDHIWAIVGFILGSRLSNLSRLGRDGGGAPSTRCALNDVAQTLRSGGVDRLAPLKPESQWGVSDWHSSEGGNRIGLFLLFFIFYFLFFFFIFPRPCAPLNKSQVMTA